MQIKLFIIQAQMSQLHSILKLFFLNLKGPTYYSHLLLMLIWCYCLWLFDVSWDETFAFYIYEVNYAKHCDLIQYLVITSELPVAANCHRGKSYSNRKKVRFTPVKSGSCCRVIHPWQVYSIIVRVVYPWQHICWSENGDVEKHHNWVKCM